MKIMNFVSGSYFESFLPQKHDEKQYIKYFLIFGQIELKKTSSLENWYCMRDFEEFDQYLLNFKRNFHILGEKWENLDP